MFKPSLKPTEVVVFPSPAGVGVIAVTRIKLLYFIYIILFYGDLSIAKGVISSYSRSISFEKQSTNIPVQIDGDYLGSFAKVNIEASSKNINLICGYK